MAQWNGHEILAPPHVFAILIEHTKLLERIDNRTAHTDGRGEHIEIRLAKVEQRRAFKLPAIPWRDLAFFLYGLGVIAAAGLGKIAWTAVPGLIHGSG